MLAQVRVASCVAWYWRNRNAQANLNDRNHSADYVWIMANRRSYLLIILYLNSFILPFCTRRWGFSDRTRMAFLLWLQYVGCLISEKQRKLSASFLVMARNVRFVVTWDGSLVSCEDLFVEVNSQFVDTNRYPQLVEAVCRINYRIAQICRSS